MADPPPASARPASERRGVIDRLIDLLTPRRDTRDELIESLAQAEDRDVIGADSRAMLEGVIRMADMTAGDVMVAAPRMDLLDIAQDYETLLDYVIQTAHSRFPVREGDAPEIVGILLAKDLLKLQRAPGTSLRSLVRPAVFVPESKNLNELLRDFRSNRNHMAIVIDEFGATAGLITIEDVLEEIVGEIEDEFDVHVTAADSGVVTLPDGTWRVAGHTPIAVVNGEFGLALPEDAFDTVGGLVADRLGHVPRRGEQVELDGLLLTVMLTRGGAVRWFRATRPAPAATAADASAAG